MKPRTAASSTLREHALNAVNKADTTDELNRIRDKVEKYLASGDMTPADADEVFGEANHRQDVLDPT